MLQWYVRYHTLACVVPAMFIAGAIATFFSKEAVLRHLGPKANKVEAYGVASVSGTVLAVCSCSVLPMFAGIYRVGAGLGPASAFLYSGPAINVMAIFLTARVLGFDLGIARIIGSVVFAVVIGLIMAVVFRKDEEERTAAVMQLPDPPPAKRQSLADGALLRCMIAFLVFSDWANPSQTIMEDRGRTRTARGRAAEDERDVPRAARGAAGRPEEGRQAEAAPSTRSPRKRTARPRTTSGPPGSTTIAGTSPGPVSWPCWPWSGGGSTARNWPSGWTRRGASRSRSFRCCSAACW